MIDNNRTSTIFLVIWLLFFGAAMLPVATAQAAPAAKSPEGVVLPKEPVVPTPAEPQVPRPGQTGGAKQAGRAKPVDSKSDAGKDDSADENRTQPPGPPRQVSPPADTERLLRRGLVRVELRPEKFRLVTAPFSGTLLEIMVRDGDFVEKDAPLARMDSGREERALADARKTLADAVDKLQQGPDGKASGSLRETPENELARLADKIRQAEEALEKTTLQAPFRARVTELRAVPGQYLKHGDAVCELAEPSGLEIVASVPSVWVRNLEPGHIIWVLVDETGKSYEATITRLGGKVDPATRTIRAYARFNKDIPELLPGMSGTADFWPSRKQ